MISSLDHKLATRFADQSQFDRGDVAFIIVSGALVLWMVPGLGFLYSGLSRRKNALSLLWGVVFANAVVIIQWFFWGYSLAFSGSATNGYIGNLNHIGLRNVLAAPSPGSPLIPELLYSFFQLEFACVTVGILIGGIAERGRVMPAMIFTFIWMTIVYCPVACWVWNTNGWAYKWGVLDYAGGGPVEIASGVGGLAYAFVLGRRRERELLNFRPHNVSLVCLGTFMLWLGWIGFNAGSAFGANLRAVTAAWNSNICAAMGGITWCLLDFRVERKYTMVGFCSGTIAGLVAATPSSGFIPTWASIILGIVAGATCNYATKLKFIFRIDDSLDLFAEHAVAGILGLLANGLFAADYIISLDGVNTSISGGWVNHNYKQLYKQLVYILAVAAYVFTVTALIAKLFDLFPGGLLRLRASDQGEIVGMDEDQLGEFVQDFVELRRDFDSWSAPGQQHDARHGSPSTTNVDEKEKRDGGDLNLLHPPSHGHDENMHRKMYAAGDRHGVPDRSEHGNGAAREHGHGGDVVTVPEDEQ